MLFWYHTTKSSQITAKNRCDGDSPGMDSPRLAGIILLACASAWSEYGTIRQRKLPLSAPGVFFKGYKCSHKFPLGSNLNLLAT